MDVNALAQADDSTDFYDSGDRDADVSTASAELSSALMAKVEAMVQHRVAAMLQSKETSYGNRGANGRVPGLSASDISKLRAEGRCFRCKQKGHSKRDCPKGNGVGKASFP